MALILLGGILSSGCMLAGPRPVTEAAAWHRIRAGRFLVASERPISPDAEPIETLLSLEAQIEERLKLNHPASDDPIEVYLFEDAARFSQFMAESYPTLPPRRAFFLALDDVRQVFAHYGETVTEDVRHEAAHALLHLVVEDLPLWLDEGLAEEFESPGMGIKQEHLERLRTAAAEGWKPDLDRLERLTDVRQMTTCDYAESWLWVRELLDTETGRGYLTEYLSAIRNGDESLAPLSGRLASHSELQPAHLMKRIELGLPPRERSRLVAVDPRAATIRLQNPASSRRGGLRALSQSVGAWLGAILRPARTGRAGE